MNSKLYPIFATRGKHYCAVCAINAVTGVPAQQVEDIVLYGRAQWNEEAQAELIQTDHDKPEGVEVWGAWASEIEFTLKTLHYHAWELKKYRNKKVSKFLEHTKGVYPIRKFLLNVGNHYIAVCGGMYADSFNYREVSIAELPEKYHTVENVWEVYKADRPLWT